MCFWCFCLQGCWTLGKRRTVSGWYSASITWVTSCWRCCCWTGWRRVDRAVWWTCPPEPLRLGRWIWAFWRLIEIWLWAVTTSSSSWPTATANCATTCSPTSWQRDCRAATSPATASTQVSSQQQTTTDSSTRLTCLLVACYVSMPATPSGRRPYVLELSVLPIPWTWYIKSALRNFLKLGINILLDPKMNWLGLVPGGPRSAGGSVT